MLPTLKYMRSQVAMQQTKKSVKALQKLLKDQASDEHSF